MSTSHPPGRASTDLYLLPLGAGGYFVRLNGRAYEAVAALRERRARSALVWGRDELGAGEMWSSNSLISLLVVRSGLDVEAVPLPRGGRAPGWHAGIVLARRQAVA